MVTKQLPGVVYHFGDCTFDARSMRLTRHGATVEIQSQTADLLLHFLQHPGRILGKDELLRSVWRNTHLTDSAIAQAVRKLRVAIGDDRRTMLRTVHNKGFKLTCAVVTAPLIRSKQGRPWIALLALAVVTLGVLLWSPWLQPPPSSAAPVRWWVDEFDNATGEAAADWVEVGLSRTLKHLLGWNEQLQVLELEQKPESPELDRVRRFVGADYALHVAVERLDQRYRLVAQIASPDGPQTIELDGPDLVLLTRELARRCAAMAQQQALAAGPQHGDFADPLVAELYARASHALAANEDRQAVELLEAALARDGDNLELQIKLLEANTVRIGHAAVVVSLQELIARQGEAFSSLQRARLLHRLGDYLWYLGSIDSARKLLEQARAMADEASPVLRGLILNSLAAVVQSSGDLDQAWGLATLALTQFRKSNDAYHTSLALTNLAYMADDLGRLDSARQLHQEALDIRLRFGFPEFIAASRYGLARILRRSGEPAEAQLLLQQNIPVVEQLGLKYDLFDNLEELAEVQRALAQFKAAGATLDRAQLLAQQGDDQLGIAWAHSVRGKLMRDVGDYEQAQHWFGQAIDIMQSLEEVHEAAYAMVELAETQLRAGQVTEALERIDVLEQQFPASSSSNVLTRLRHLRALAKAQPQDRIEALRQALRGARAVGAYDLEAAIARDLSVELIAQEDWDQAETALAVAQAWSPEHYATLALEARFWRAQQREQAAREIEATLRHRYPEVVMSTDQRLLEAVGEN